VPREHLVLVGSEVKMGKYTSCSGWSIVVYSKMEHTGEETILFCFAVLSWNCLETTEGQNENGIVFMCRRRNCDGSIRHPRNSTKYLQGYITWEWIL